MPSRFSAKFSTRGFSLIEMMVVLGAMSVMTFGIMQFMLTNMNVSKSFELTSRLDQTMVELQMVLKDSTVCGNNIANFAPNPFDPSAAGPAPSITVSQIQAANPVLIANGASLPNSSGTSVRMVLENFNNVNATSYTADLSVTLDKGPIAVGGRIIKRSIPLILTTSGATPTVTISGCSAFATGSLTPANICALVGGTFDPVAGKCNGTAFNGTCPAGTLMSGISASGVQCKVVSVPATPPAATGAYTPTNPGPGCNVAYCTTYDYGPCNGAYCRTNGGGCTGAFCCSGPACL